MHIAKHIVFLSILIFIVSGCTASTTEPIVPTPKTMTDKIQQSESNYNNAVGDVIDMREDLDGYDLGI